MNFKIIQTSSSSPTYIIIRTIDGIQTRVGLSGTFKQAKTIKANLL